MDPMGGCLCIGCLEKRLNRVLRPKDFQRGHPFNIAAGHPASPAAARAARLKLAQALPAADVVAVR
jgi:hypothetical protein